MSSIDQIKSRLSVADVLGAIDEPPRSSKRANCPLCSGTSRETLSFTDELWTCHRCNAGGDVFSLIQAARHVEFTDALEYAADLAHVSLNHSRDAACRWAAHERRQQLIQNKCDELKAAERSLRIATAAQIRRCYRVLNKPGPWINSDWRRASAAFVLLRDFLEPEYELLAFGPMEERLRYVKAQRTEEQ